jgi:RNA polymerase sigma factor (sigma-70 family)
MAEHPLGKAIRHFLRSLTSPSGDTDAYLLTRFAQRGDAEAFEVLLQRHGPMVWRTCRRMARQAADAEDAFQATFLVLCRKAGSIEKGESLGAWLHQVAHHIALKANARSTFRALDEAPADACQTDPAAALLHSELRLLLDEALSRLPKKYRLPLVLCCLEGQTRARAAAELGWTEGTLSSRLARGKELLRAHLLRRGIVPSAGALAAFLTEEGAAQAVPLELMRATLKAKALFLLAEAGASGGQALRAIILAKGALKTMFLTKVKIAAMVLLSLGLLGVGAGTLIQQVLADKPAAGVPPLLAKDEQPAAKPTSNSAANAAVPAQQSPAGRLRVLVLDPQDKPLAGAPVHADIWTNDKGRRSGPEYGAADATADYETDAQGVALIDVPKSSHDFFLHARTRQFVPIWTGWNHLDLASGKKVPAEFTFRLESGVRAGGRVVDEQGKPIAGATVQVQANPSGHPANSNGQTAYDIWLATGKDAARTDAKGRWRIENVPAPDTGLSLLVSHPDYVSDQRWGATQNAAGVTTEMLLRSMGTVTLLRGVSVHGRVTDAAGKPIQNAILVRGDKPIFASTPSRFATDADGRFRLPPLPPRETTLTVLAPGWAPQLRRIDVHEGLPPQDFHLEPGKLIQLRIVDASGKPVPHAQVRISGWRGVESLSTDRLGDDPNFPRQPDLGIPRRADDRGVWKWTGAPSDPVYLQIDAKGFATYQLESTGGAPVRTVTLNSEPPSQAGE